MGVYIKDMEMPKSCPCELVGIGYDMCCSFVHGIPARVKEYDECCKKKTRPDWCPLIEVPPHGDLIDRDALRSSIRESIDECRQWADEVDKDTMMYARISQAVGTFVECSLRAKAAPAVIEAEEAE